MAITEQDVTIENFLRKVTFASDATPGGKLAIPDGDFFVSLALLKLCKIQEFG